MLRPKLIFCHGFGLTPHYWNRLLPYFSDFNIINLDLGYFAQATYPSKLNESSSQVFAIGHSLGWAKLENLGLKFKASVGLQAFRHFLGYQLPLKQKRMQELKLLQQLLERNPKSCLRYFYQRCGLPHTWPSTNSANIERLKQDLHSLDAEWQITSQHPKLIIASEEDPIVPAELIIDNFDMQKHVDYILLPQGRHDLGYNHPEIIAPIIRDFFNAHQHN